MEKRPFITAPKDQKPIPFDKETFSFQTEFGKTSGVRYQTHSLKKQIPILYVIGWGATVDVHKAPIESLAQKGYDVIAINPPRTDQKRSHNIEFVLPHIEVAKAQASIQTLKMQGVKKTNIVAHSEGGIYGTIAAYLAPQYGITVDTLILVAPGGLMGKDSSLNLIPRFFSNSATEEKKTGEKDTAGNKRLRRKEAVKTLLNPLLSLKEANAIASTNLVNILKELKKRGVKIVVIQAGQDKVFTLEKMEIEAKKAGVDLFYQTPNGGHNSLITRPERLSAQIDNAIKA